MSEEIKLLPCPHCGGEAEIEEVEDDFDDDTDTGMYYSIGCCDAGCIGHESFGGAWDTPKEAARLWNLRVFIPVVELEWKEDELGRIVASFNDIITATCYKSGLDWFACIEFDGIPTLFTSGENNYGASTIEIARAWCVAEIQKIITPTPKP